ISIDPHGVCVSASRQLGDTIDRRTIGMLEYEPRQIFNIANIEFGQHFNQSFVADFVAGGQRIEIAHKFVYFSPLVANDIYQVFVNDTSFSELHDGDKDALLVHFASVWAEATTANVDHVSGTCEETNESAVVERGADYCEIVKVPRSLPWIVRNI